MPVDKFGRMSDTKTKDTGVSLTYINNNYIRRDGDTPVSGSINMNGNTLYNEPDPVNPQDVATKEYADNKRKHIIAVHSYYIGPLRKDEFQFSFGGYFEKNSLSADFKHPGFLIPHSGRIIKVKMKTPIYEESFKDLFIIKDRVNLGLTKDGFFAFTKIKGSDDISFSKIIGNIKCKEAYKLYFKKPGDDEKKLIGYDFCFDDDLPIFDPEVEEGDIINIKTMINLDFPHINMNDDDAIDKDLDLDRHIFKYPYFENIYLISFLIELDPL